MRKIILVIASATALGAATMTTGALAQRGHGGGMSGGEPHFGGGFGRHGFGGRPGLGGPEFEHREFDRRFAFRRRFFGPRFGIVTAAGWPDWWDNGWDNGCLSRWEQTPFGWRQRLC